MFAIAYRETFCFTRPGSKIQAIAYYLGKKDLHEKQRYLDERQFTVRSKYKHNNGNKSRGKPHKRGTNIFLPICDVPHSHERVSSAIFKLYLSWPWLQTGVTCMKQFLSIHYYIWKTKPSTNASSGLWAASKKFKACSNLVRENLWPSSGQNNEIQRIVLWLPVYNYPMKKYFSFNCNKNQDFSA